MAGGKGNEMGEAFHRHGVAVAQRGGERLAEEQCSRHSFVRLEVIIPPPLFARGSPQAWFSQNQP
jgi:hypothetical protein